MQIRAPIALKAALKALTDVVLPALPADNQMAQEQGHLIVALLSLIADRIGTEFAYDKDELARLIGLGDQLNGDTPFAEALDQARAILAKAGASPADLQATIAMLRGAIGQQATALSARSDAEAQAASKAILQSGREQTLRERSWLLSQGWEVDPASVPPIAALLDNESKTS